MDVVKITRKCFVRHIHIYVDVRRTNFFTLLTVDGSEHVNNKQHITLNNSYGAILFSNISSIFLNT